MQKLWKVVGPVVLSALSIFITILLIQPIALWLDPTFNLLANRGIGKIGITVLVIWHILILLLTQSKAAVADFLQTNLMFFKNGKWIKTFLKFFALFALLHVIFLSAMLLFGYANIVPITINFNFSLITKIMIGFVATFFLAWTEELIFRGTVYKIFASELSPFVSAIAASIIFTLAHNLTNPLALLTTDYKLGLGLFLLGLLLNVVFIITDKLYTNMGIHAGLVFVKVFLRKVPFITFLSPGLLPFFINNDLRQSMLVHVLFATANVFLIFKFRSKFFKTVSK